MDYSGADYSGADYTGTGDSGFSESWNNLRRPIALPRHTGASKSRRKEVSAMPTPTPAPRYPSKPNTGYTSLNTDEVRLSSYYKTTARELNQALQGKMIKHFSKNNA